VTAGWVAASTRGRLLLHRRIGASGAARALAKRGVVGARPHRTGHDGLRRVAPGRRRPPDRPAVRRARPRSGSCGSWPAGCPPTRRARPNVRRVGGDRRGRSPREPPGPAGRRTGRPGSNRSTQVVGLAGNSVASGRTGDHTRSGPQHLARSAWGDPGGQATRPPSDSACASRGVDDSYVRRRSRPTGYTAAAAVLVARERFLFGRDIPEIPARGLDQLLGPRWRTCDLGRAELADNVPKSASWALLADRSSEPPATDLWRSELAVIRRVDRCDRAGSSTPAATDANTVAAVMALLLVDLWRVGAAIESAGGRPPAGGVR
jgi:hypothetical protein